MGPKTLVPWINACSNGPWARKQDQVFHFSPILTRKPARNCHNFLLFLDFQFSLLELFLVLLIFLLLFSND